VSLPRLRKEKTADPTPPVPPWERLGEVEEYHELCRVRLEHLVPVREPLVLISQIQRSGGTLLSQLLDGHRECHADPFELKIGYPKKHNWPPLDLARPETWFEHLFDSGSLERLRRTDRTRRPDRGRSVFPCLFLPRLQKAIFDASVAAAPPESEREVLDRYFTSYFNAWLDNQNLYTGPKKVVTGFTPRLAMEPVNIERFFSAYSDGSLISIVRDPRAWYSSAREHRRSYGDLVEAVDLWRQSTEAALKASERFGKRVLLLTYEELVSAPEETMSRVAERIGISISPKLLEPTFNGMPIPANSSSPADGCGILPDRAGAYREALDAATIAQIEELAGDLYDRAAARAAG
jgi:Sulfotransferase family